MTFKTTIYASKQHEETQRLAKEFARDKRTTMSDLIWTAVDDYLTVHQHIVPSTAPKLATIRDAAMRIRKHGCAYVRSGDKCTQDAYWVFWDSNRPYLDTYDYSCKLHLSMLLDPDIDGNTVQRIEY